MPTVLARTIDSNYIYAQRSDQDGNGNDIALTYATKSELPVVDQNYSAISANAQSGVAVASAIAAATPAPYTAGDAIDITNNEISVLYNTSTLDLQAQSSNTTVSYDRPATDMVSSAQYFELSGDVAAAFSGASSDITSVVLHIPENVFYFSGEVDTSSTPVKVCVASYSMAQNNTASYITTDVATTYNSTSNETVVDEQDITLQLPASNSAYWNKANRIDSESETQRLMIYTVNNGTIATAAQIDTGNLRSDNLTITYSGGAGTATLTVKNPLPASALADAGKVLQVNASGNAEWATAVSVTVDQTYNAASTNAQSGTAVAGALAGLSIPVIGTVEV